MRSITKLIVIIWSCVAFGFKLAIAEPLSPYKAGVKLVTEINLDNINSLDVIKLTFSNYPGSFSLALHKNSRVIAPALEANGQNNAYLFRGAIKRAGITIPVAADIIGDRLKLSYLNRRKRFVQLIIPLPINNPSVRRGVLATRRVVSKYKTLPCGNAPKSAAAIATESNATIGTGRVDLILPALSPTRNLELTTYADYEFSQRFGSNSNAEMQSIVNTAAVIYLSQLGVNLSIVAQHTFASSSDLFVSTNSNGEVDSNQLLDTFADTVSLSSSLPSASANHLFTGRNLNNSVVGLSYIGQVCKNSNRYSYGLTEYTNSALQPIVFAHELGHDLNADHTSVGAGIMSPIVSTSYDTFSSQSIREISDFIINNGGCLSFNGASLRVTGRKYSDGTARIQTKVSGDLSSPCTLKLYSSRKRVRTLSAISNGKLLSTKIVSAAGSTTRRVKVSGRSTLRRYYISGTITCSVSGVGDVVGGSNALTVDSSRSGFNSVLGAAFSR